MPPLKANGQPSRRHPNGPAEASAPEHLEIYLGGRMIHPLRLRARSEGERASSTACRVPTTIIGMVVPSFEPRVWTSAPGIGGPFLFFPAMIAASVAADAFAGERERRTRETLLATPLSDGAIFAGKALTAILFSTLVSTLALTVSVITVNVRRAARPVPAAARPRDGGAGWRRWCGRGRDRHGHRHLDARRR